MKRFITVILAILVLMLLAGGIYVINAGKKPTQESIEEVESDMHGSEDIFDDYEKPNSGDKESMDDVEEESGEENESSNAQTPEIRELTVPSNVSSITESGLTMLKGAAIYLEETDRPELKFTCEVSKEVYDKQSANYEIGIMLAPLAYFDAVNTNSYTVIDWISEFKVNNLQYLTQSAIYATEASSTGYMAKFRLTDIAYENINRKFCALPYVKITDGSTVTYKYGAFEENATYRTSARSVAYVAGAALSAYDQGKEIFSEESVARLKRYIMESRDYAHGLTEPTYDEEYYDVKLIWSEIYALEVGGTAQVTCYVEEDVDVLIQFKSTDTSVFTVDQNGLITAVGKGKAVLEVYIAGLYAEIDVEI